MGRIIVFDTGYQTVSAAQDLLELKLASTQAGFVRRAKIMQSSDETSSDLELLQVAVKRASGSYTSGSGGGSATVVKKQSGAAAHGLSGIERNNTTQAVIGTGALDTIEPGVFNVLAAEWEWCPIPELALPLEPSEAVILSLDEAPTDALTLRAIIELEISHG